MDVYTEFIRSLYRCLNGVYTASSNPDEEGGPLAKISEKISSAKISEKISSAKISPKISSAKISAKISAQKGGQ